MEYEIILFLITAIFIIYTIIGGQYSVVGTDIIQFIVMIVGICIIATPLLLIEALPNLSSLSSDTFSFPVNNKIGILGVCSIFFMMFMPHIVGPDIYSKLLSAKNIRIARKGSILSGIFKFIFAISIGIIGLSAAVLYPSLEISTLAIPTAVASLSPLIAGVVLAAFISVMLSSADSCLLSAGTILSVDITRKNNILTSRIGILFVGMSALILAIYYTKFGDILDTLKLAYTVFTSGFTLPVIFGFYKSKTHVTSKGALWSLVLGGTISIIWLHFAPYGEYAVLIGLLISVIPLLIFRESTYENPNIKTSK